jgi:putative nucleotidyltransferase with HDIG domain
MVLEMTFIRSRVARRIVLLFVICALIPISVLGLLSYRQVTRHLAEQSRSRLQLYSKTMGMNIYERLISLQAEMQVIAFQPAKRGAVTVFTNPSEEYQDHLAQRFLSLDLISDRGDRQHIFGEKRDLPKLAASEMQHGLGGETLVFVGNSPSGESRIFMAIPVPEEDGPTVLLLSELRGTYLWYMGDENTLPPGAELQVLGPNQQLIFTSIPEVTGMPTSALDLIQNSSSGEFKWRFEREDRVASFRQLFMESQFRAARWTVVVSESASYLNAPAAYFKRIFPPVLLLSVWIIIFLSLSQVRRSLIPLESLKTGVKRMAQGDFKARVVIKRPDEFGEVGSCFNEMAVELGRQFKTLSARAEIDRAVLAAMDTTVIASTFVQSMHQIFPCQGAGMILLENDEILRGKIYLAVEGFQDLDSEPVRLNPEDISELRNNRSVFSLRYPAKADGFLSGLTRRGLSAFHIFPVFLKDSLASVIILGYSEEAGFQKTNPDQVRQMADQVGVALTNAHLVRDLHSFHWGALTALARAIDAKSHWTAGHSEKSTQLALEIGQVMHLSLEELNTLKSGGLLHDIGKLGIPNEILDKAGPLTEKERAVLQTHPRLGARILEPVSAFKAVIDIVLHHHENFDGTGYPEGLAGKNITLGSRIFALADRFEAMTSDRPYRKTLSQDAGIAIVKEQSGLQFDPEVAKAFMQVVKGWRGGRESSPETPRGHPNRKDPTGIIVGREVV